MPIMPRMSGKARKIAYKILGLPLNMVGSKKNKQSKTQKLITIEETEQVR
jgi:hypothetical protein